MESDRKNKGGEGERGRVRACKNFFNDPLPPTYGLMKCRKVKMFELLITFDHNFLIRSFQRALRRDLIEDSFLFKAAFDLKPPASFIRSSVVFQLVN